MPKVPTVGLNASPLPGFQAPGVTAYRSAVPRMIQEGGKAMEGLGKVATEISLKVENDIHDANTLEATNEAELTYNRSLQQHEALKGKEATDAKKGALDDFDAAMSIISDRLHPIAQRQFKKARDRLQGKHTLRVEVHHAKAAAEQKTQALLARKAVLADQLFTNPISAGEDAETIERVLGEGQYGPIASAEFLSNYTRYLATAREQGILEGYSDEAAENGMSPLDIFVQGEADKLFKNLVVKKLDSEDPNEVREVERLVDNLPEGLISQSLLESLQDRSSIKAQESDDAVGLVKSYSSGETLSEVFAEIDAQLNHGIITSKEHKSRRVNAANYYTEQNSARSVDKELLLNEVAALRAQGKPVPESLRDRAVGLQAVREFDRIVSGQDSWLPSGRETYLRYMENPNQLLSDMKKDPDLLTRLNSQMPWSVVMELSKMAKKQREAISGGSGTSNGSRSKASLWTNREKALSLHYKYSRSLAEKNQTTVEESNGDLSKDQKGDIEFRWRQALEEAATPYLQEGLSPTEALEKGAEDLWKRGSYQDAEGNMRNTYTDVAGALPQDIANLRNERNEEGRLQVDVAREELENERIDRSVEKKIEQKRAAKMPPSPALLGMVDYWGTMDKATQDTLADLQASQEVFGIPLALPREIRLISQQEVDSRAASNIEKTKETKNLESEDGQEQRRLRAVSSLNKIMETEAYDSLVDENKKGIGIFTDAYNTLGWLFTSYGSKFEADAAYESLPGQIKPQVRLGGEAAKSITINEGGVDINVFEEFMQSGGTEEEWNQIVGKHRITDHFLMPKDPATHVLPLAGQGQTLGVPRRRNVLTAADYQDLSPEKIEERSRQAFARIERSVKNISRKVKVLDQRIDRLKRMKSAHPDDANLQAEAANNISTLEKERYVKSRALEMAQKKMDAKRDQK